MFTNGWALAMGGAAIMLPVVIHWLTKPRPARMPVSTLRFIRGAVEQRRSRYRLRNFLILLLRTVAIALLAMAVARPLLHHQVTASTSESATVTRIVILDCSQSMGSRDGGIIRFERARPLVSELLRQQPSLKCNLLLAAASPNSVFDAPTTNLGVLRDSLQKASVRPERLRLQPTLNSAAEMFSAGDQNSQQEVVIVSDFQRANWAAADFSVFPKDCQIQLRSVAATEEAANLAVLEFTPQGRIESGREAEAVIRIGNYSETARHVRVEVQLENVVVPFEGFCPARAVTGIGGRIPVNGEGWHFGTVRLIDADDALPDDNVLTIGLQVHPQPRIAILTRDKADQIPSASYYIERALSSTFSRSTSPGIATSTAQKSIAQNDIATRNSDEAIQPGTAAPATATQASGAGTAAGTVMLLNAADPDVDLLRQADVIVLARPGRLSAETLTVLTAMLQRGRSLLYVAGDQLDAANLNDLAKSLGSSVRLPVDFFPRPAGRSQATRFLTDVDRRRPPFSIFGDELAAAVRSLEFSDGLLTRPAKDGLKDDIRATLSDQSAFLTVTAVGRGRLAVMNTDLERSNIARTPVLVPLLGELLSQELTTTDSRCPVYSCGEPFTLQLPVGEERLSDLSFLGPGNTSLSEAQRGQLTAIPAGIVWDMFSTPTAGAWQVQLEGRTVSGVVTSIPSEESDLRSIPENVFADRLSGGRTLTYSDGSMSGEERQDDVWVWLASACLGCMILELLTLRLFGT